MFAPLIAAPIRQKKTGSATNRALSSSITQAPEHDTAPALGPEYANLQPRVSWNIRSLALNATERKPPTSPSGAARPKSQLSRAPERKLAVGRVHDPLESEAETIAEQMVRSPGAQPEITQAVPLLRRTSDDRRRADSAHRLPRVSSAVAQTEPPHSAPVLVRDALRAPAQNLRASDRAFFETRLGHDLSRVKIHDEQLGAQSAASIDAQAYTVGQHIVFGASQYQPTTSAGRRLLAHELVHTIQQAGHQALSSGSYAISRSPLQISRQVAHEQTPVATGSRVGYVAVYLGGGTGKPLIVFHTKKGMVSYDLEVGDLRPGEYDVSVTNRNGKVIFDFHNVPTSFHFNFDIKPGQSNPASLFDPQDRVTFTVTDEEAPAPQAEDSSKQQEVRDPNATYLSLEDGLNKCNAGDLPGIKTFPYRGTRFGAAPLTVLREGGDIVVKSYIYVQQNEDFRAQTRTLPMETYIGGVHLKPDEIVRVHTYEPKWYQLNITGSTSGDVENEFCVTGEEMLAIGAKSDRDTIGNIGLTIVDAATLFIPVGKIAGIIGKPLARMAVRGSSALGISAMLALKEVAPTALAGIASRTSIVLVEEQAVDQFASRAVSKSVGHIILEFGESRGTQAASSTAAQVAASTGANAVESTATHEAATAIAHTVTVTVVDAAGHQAISTLTTPTGDREVDRMIEESFGRTFNQTLDPAASTAAGQGVVSTAPEIAAGFTQAQVRAFSRILAKPFSTSDISVLEQLWEGAARAGDQQILTAANSRYLFNLQRNRFWAAVARTPAARALFEDAGCEFAGGAPYYMLNGRRIVMTIDHIMERQTMPQLALSAANLRLSFSRENSVVLRLLNQMSPF